MHDDSKRRLTVTIDKAEARGGQSETQEVGGQKIRDIKDVGRFASIPSGGRHHDTLGRNGTVYRVRQRPARSALYGAVWRRPLLASHRHRQRLAHFAASHRYSVLSSLHTPSYSSLASFPLRCTLASGADTMAPNHKRSTSFALHDLCIQALVRYSCKLRKRTLRSLHSISVFHTLLYDQNCALVTNCNTPAMFVFSCPSTQPHLRAFSAALSGKSPV
jgi:hypothetical protein